MPTYNYKCQKCEKVYTEIRSIFDDTKLITCEDCNGKLVQVYDVSVAFKGNGFYSTDQKITIGE